MPKVKPNALPWLGLSVLLIALDQWSKALATARLPFQQPQTLIEDWAWLTLTHNYGAAFSFLDDVGGWQRWGFSALAIVISTMLVFALTHVRRNDWRQALPFALVIAGALGNVIDRIRFGYVVDFIEVVYWPGKHFPVFNVADSAISVGAVLLVVFGLLFTGRRREEA